MLLALADMVGDWVAMVVMVVMVMEEGPVATGMGEASLDAGLSSQVVEFMAGDVDVPAEAGL